MKQLILIIMCVLSTTLTYAQEKRVMVAYFSCTGNTETVAKAIAQATDATLYRIQPQTVYSSADLDWRDKESRSSKEMGDAASRPALADKNAKAETYDVIFLGYPIWWNLCPRIINTFIESYTLDGKTVIPFATSGSSTIENSVKELKEQYGKINWHTGKLFNDGSAGVKKWAEETVAAQN
ncbi:flavodoxin [Parabacteroides sp. PFB2-10]|uniref:flavodoxin n=1 Tax=Parabacteroides sp. PFB2-10 TaxID=1742405 RepID=UPI002473767F|nr:flavodoxin [Parabacteroides sp. PFB2-10]MDH6311673.1 flavodoxin [Parabacteroides sp. PFB2-10]